MAIQKVDRLSVRLRARKCSIEVGEIAADSSLAWLAWLRLWFVLACSRDVPAMIDAGSQLSIASYMTMYSPLDPAPALKPILPQA